MYSNGFIYISKVLVRTLVLCYLGQIRRAKLEFFLLKYKMGIISILIPHDCCED